jgi:5'(3')-deoxyribonucleotidase
MQLYLDCDGVLADFDHAATALLGMPPRRFEQKHGLPAFWSRLARHPDFYGSLPLMAGARTLFDAVRHLDPIILTGVPRGDWAAAQKVRWAAEHFPGTRIITCLAADKRRHARAGDILVDDTLRYRALWTGAGGVFVHHHDVATTIGELNALIPQAMAAGAIGAA